jgi:ADP-heptose:LPS heptosyltransferase
MSEKFLWVINSGIGNATHIVPALKAIKEMSPKCELYVSTWERSYRILEGLPFIDKVFTKHPLAVLQELEFVDYLIISPVGAITHPDMAKRAKNILTNPVKPPWIKHEIEYNMDIVRAYGYEKPPPKTEIRVPYKHEENAYNFLKKEIEKHYTGSGDKKWREEIVPYMLKNSDIICINASYLRSDHWYKKHWGNDKYLQLLSRFCMTYDRNKFIFVFIGSKEDKEDANEIRKQSFLISTCAPAIKINACGFSDDIKDTAALIRMSKLVIGNDGGLMHIAAALKVPTVTIFTFTNNIKNEPYGDDNISVMLPCENRLMCQHGQWKECKCLDVPVNMVFDAVKKQMETLQ